MQGIIHTATGATTGFVGGVGLLSVVTAVPVAPSGFVIVVGLLTAGLQLFNTILHNRKQNKKP